MTVKAKAYLRAAIRLQRPDTRGYDTQEAEAHAYYALSERDKARFDPIFDEVRGLPEKQIIKRYQQLLQEGWNGIQG